MTYEINLSLGCNFTLTPVTDVKLPTNTEKVLPLPALKNAIKKPRPPTQRPRFTTASRLPPAPRLNGLLVPTQDVQNVEQVNEQPKEIQKQVQCTGYVLIRGQVVDDV